MLVNDNVISNAGSGGATFRAYSDGTIEHPASVPEYLTGGSAGAWTLQGVSVANGLPVQPGTSTVWSQNLTQVGGAAFALGQQLAASSLPVVLTASQLSTLTPLSTVQAAQSGSWSVGVTGTFWQATQPVSGTFWQATQPVSAASLPLPTGASTAAKQPALGTAGAASTDVLTIQGIASMTALSVSGTVTANAGTNLNTSLLALESGGNLATLAGGISGSKFQCTVASALPAGTNVIGHVIADTGSTTVVTGNVTAVQATGTNLHTVVDSGTITTVSTVTAVTAISNALPAGTNTIGATVAVPATTGGLSINRLLSAATTNATNVKGSVGQVYAIAAFNTGAGPAFLKLYNSASAPTAGSGTPVMTLTIPANSNGAGFVLQSAVGIAFSAGIGYTVTGAYADNDTTAITVGQVILNLLYA